MALKVTVDTSGFDAAKQAIAERCIVRVKVQITQIQNLNKTIKEQEMQD